jgi:hypothetical protein
MTIKYFKGKYIEVLRNDMERISTATLRSWWTDYGTRLLRLAVALMVVAAFVWLGYQFWRLLGQSSPTWQSSPSGAVDLKFRYNEVHRWFAGKPIYRGLKSKALYPPAS